jgi:hypothetical protein
MASERVPAKGAPAGVGRAVGIGSSGEYLIQPSVVFDSKSQLPQVLQPSFAPLHEHSDELHLRLGPQSAPQVPQCLASFVRL